MSSRESSDNGRAKHLRHTLLDSDTKDPWTGPLRFRSGVLFVSTPQEVALQEIMNGLTAIEARLAVIEAVLGARFGEDRLTEREQDILEALGEKKLTGEKVAEAAGYEYDGHFKNLLSSLVKRGILVNDHPGYRRRQSGLGQD